MICIDCKIDKEDKHFRTYTNKYGNKIHRHQCYSCLAVRQRAREGKIAQPRVYIKEPEALEIEGVTKKCCLCEKVLSLDDFYKGIRGTPFKSCKKCHVSSATKANQQSVLDNGGSTRVPVKPNVFADHVQQDQTHQFLRLLGWSYTDGVWWKKGIKTAEKVWEGFVETPKLKRKGHTKGGRKTLAIHQQVDQIIKDYEEGGDYFKLAGIYKCSHTSIRKLIRDYYDERRGN
jgi:hypothetical protein